MRGLILSLLIVFVGVGSSHSEQLGDSTCTKLREIDVTTQKTPILGLWYNPVNFWTKVKLSNTYYTNPDALKLIDFAYVYGRDVRIGSADAVPMIDLAAKGIITIGVSDDVGIKGGVKAVPWKEVASIFGEFTPEKMRGCIAQDKCVFLASTPEVLGLNSKEIVMTKAVAANKSDEYVAGIDQLCNKKRN